LTFSKPIQKIAYAATHDDREDASRTGSENPEGDCQIEIVDMMQESLVVLDRAEQGFGISVQNKGKGFDVSLIKGRGKGGGFGMLSVRERLVRVGGAFAAESAQGKGTKVTMIVPVNYGSRSEWGFDGIAT
jgi:signal transduction histidine kinase